LTFFTPMLFGYILDIGNQVINFNSTKPNTTDFDARVGDTIQFRVENEIHDITIDVIDGLRVECIRVYEQDIEEADDDFINDENNYKVEYGNLL
jgi:hypothetical protein